MHSGWLPVGLSCLYRPWDETKRPTSVVTGRRFIIGSRRQNRLRCLRDRNLMKFITNGQRVPSLTVENYLKAILQISMQSGSASVSTGELADALAVLPGTVTSMLKTLDEAKLASYTPYAGAVLTAAGRNWPCGCSVGTG